MLTVRCGKSVSITVAEMLSTSLCGEGCHPEIFISRLALGANHTSRIEHDKIYQVHHDYLADLCYTLLLFPSRWVLTVRRSRSTCWTLEKRLFEHHDNGLNLSSQRKVNPWKLFWRMLPKTARRFCWYHQFSLRWRQLRLTSTGKDKIRRLRRLQSYTLRV